MENTTHAVVTKDNALKCFIEDIQKSWTWGRLTPKEKATFLFWIGHERFVAKGTAKQRWETLNNYYTMFLSGCGYLDSGRVADWRELKGKDRVDKLNTIISDYYDDEINFDEFRDDIKTI